MSNSKHENDEGRKVRNSRAYNKAKSKAEEYLDDTDEITKLAIIAIRKSNRNMGPLGKIIDKLGSCIRLLKAYANGSYRRIPWQSLVMIITAIIYFVMPIDLIPDFIVGLGLIDDAAILAWTMNTVKNDIVQFEQWEKQNISRNA